MDNAELLIEKLKENAGRPFKFDESLESILKNINNTLISEVYSAGVENGKKSMAQQCLVWLGIREW